MQAKQAGVMSETQGWPTGGLRRKALVVAMAAAMAGPAWAQQPVTVLGEISVVGQAASLESALDVQQLADNIVSVVHADAIGQLPDRNAAEALQRIPGLSVERDQGEGRYVRVRGISPDLNAVTINGSLVPAPESDVRAVALDVLPAGLIRSLEVTKTLEPRQDANSIGGTIEVKTISAFDHKGLFYSIEGGLSHDTNVSETSPDFAAAWSNRFMDGKLGIAAGLSTAKRKFGSDNTETGGAWDLDAGNALEEFQRRDYQITRERHGAVVNVDFRPRNDEAYYLRTLFSRFSDDETRHLHNIEFDDAQLAGVLGDTESVRELKARKETHDIFSAVLGMDRKLGGWDLSAALGFSRSSQDTPDDVESVFESGTTYTSGFVNTRRPALIGDAAINLADDHELDGIEIGEQLTKDTERNLRLDLGRNFKAWGLDNELKFGAKVSRREKTNELTAWEIDGGDFGNPALSGFTSGHVDYAYGEFGPAISAAAINAFLAGIDKSGYLNDEDSRINDFTMHEDINAAYLQNTFSSGLWRILAGVRYEGTKFKANGTGIRDDVYESIVKKNSYHDWLPALHVRRDLDNDTSLRAAWTNSVVRPTFGQLAPGFIIDGDEAEFGNPDLKALTSSNLDLGIERRLGYAGVVSAYVFHKDIDNFVYETDLAGSGAWAAFDEAKTYANGSKAKISGLELAYARSFRHLPAPWNGLLFSANATFTDSDARISSFVDGGLVTRNIPLPSQSDVTLNLMLGYETGPWSLRLAANHKSKYLDEVADIEDPAQDLYVDAQTHFDFAARYKISKRMQLAFEALNLSNEHYYVYSGQRDRNAQHEAYGRTYKLSLKLTDF